MNLEEVILEVVDSFISVSPEFVTMTPSTITHADECIRLDIIPFSDNLSKYLTAIIMLKVNVKEA